MLIYWALSNRYRIEFAPALDAVALLAFALPQGQHAQASTRPRRLLLLAAAASIGTTFVLDRLAFHGKTDTILQQPFCSSHESR